MRALTSSSLVLALVLGCYTGASFAISGNDQVALAGEGRFEELRQALEQDAAKGPLKTRDLHALCYAYSKTKRYARLFSCLDKLADNIARGDVRTRLFGLDDATPSMHLMRAEAQLELGNYQAAAGLASKTLAWMKDEDSDDTDMELHALSILSLAATLGGNRADGEKYAKQLEQVSTFTLTGSGYVSAKAMAMAKAHMALGNYQGVLDAIAQDRMFTFHAFIDRLVSGAALTGKNNWAWQELPRAFMVNRALRGIGKNAEARQGYDQLLAIPQVKDNGEIYWVILFERGLIAEAEGKVDDAIGFYRKAIEVIEEQRSSINTEASKIGFVGDKQRVYEQAVHALYAAGRQKEAFEYIERSKSRALVDMLAARQVLGADTASPASQLLKQYEEADSELIAQVPVSATEGKQTQRALAAAAKEKIRAAAPELSTLVSVSSIPASQLFDALPEQEAVLQYYYQGPTLYVTVLTQRQIHMQQLDATGLEDEIRQFREAVDKMEPQALALSQKLHQRLIRPVEDKIGKARALLVIPHGALHYLPFTALHDGKQYLLDSHAMRFLPSASVMPYLKRGRDANRDAALVFGNPDLGDPRLDLPSAQAEAERIAAHAKQSKLLLRRDATETALKATASQYAVLHIASHGVFNSKAPLDSALMLSKDGSNDGKLTVGELYSLRLNADLVTLSACETGLGQINSGDDVVGLTRGFLYAGASSVVASLWQVDDEATSQLMIRFYTELANKPKADALRTAQLEVKKKFPHPYFWSAFYLTGNAR